MKIKNLKKNIKQELFNFSISKNMFLIFENKHIFSSIKSSINENIVTESFSKQIFNRLKSQEYSKLKFPIKVRTLPSISDLLVYFFNLKEKNKTLGIYLLKIGFLILKKNLHIVTDIYIGTKSVVLFNSLVFIKLSSSIKIFNNGALYPVL